MKQMNVGTVLLRSTQEIRNHTGHFNEEIEQMGIRGLKMQKGTHGQLQEAALTPRLWEIHQGVGGIRI